MPLCPNCHTNQTKRVQGSCPNCGIPVENHNGYWYRAGTGSPALALLKHFELRVSQGLSRDRDTAVVFQVPRRSARYRRELVSAERLLKMADYDLELAKETIDVLFHNKRFNWKSRNSLLYLDSDFIAALAIATANRTSARAKAEAEQAAVRRVLQREDIFS